LNFQRVRHYAFFIIFIYIKLKTSMCRIVYACCKRDTTVTVSLQDIHMRKAFKSSVVFDQQVVSRDTVPTAMLETYQTCDKPPPLDKLNSYRLVSASNRMLVAERFLLMCYKTGPVDYCLSQEI
jgi:hypothetical protein